MFILLQPSRPAALAGVSCRLCGAQGPDAAFLDVRTGGEPGRRLAVRARKHLQVEIEEGAACQPCAGRLEEWDRFYDQCRRFQDDVAAAATHGPTAVAVAVDDGLSKLVEELVQDSHGHHQQPAPPPPNSNGSDCLPNGPAVVPAEFAPEAIEGDDAVHDQPQADEEDRVDHDDDDHDDDDEEDGGEEEEDDDDDDDGEDHDDDNGTESFSFTVQVLLGSGTKEFARRRRRQRRRVRRGRGVVGRFGRRRRRRRRRDGGRRRWRRGGVALADAPQKVHLHHRLPGTQGPVPKNKRDPNERGVSISYG